MAAVFAVLTFSFWTFLEHFGTSIRNTLHLGRAVAQRLDVGFPPRRTGFTYGQHVGFVVDKAALEQVFSEYFGFPCQSFIDFSIIIITWG
jgi:hypothetical protein